MKRAASLALLLIITPAVGAQVTRTTKGDTTFITTKGNGAWGAMRTAVEVLRIGDDSLAREGSFGNLIVHAALPDGGVVLFDENGFGGPALRIFDANGRFVRNISRTGSGPGEFRSIPSILISRDNRIMTSDPLNGRINVYSLTGSFLYQQPLASESWSLHQLLLGSGREFFVTEVLASREAGRLVMGKAFHQTDSSGRVSRSQKVAPRESPEDPDALHTGILANGAIVTAKSFPASITIQPSAGSRGVVITSLDLPRIPNPPRTNPPPAIPENANPVVRSALSAVGAWTPFTDPFETNTLTIEAGNRIWIRQTKPLITHDEASAGAVKGRRYRSIVYGVFSADGVFLGDVFLPGIASATDISIAGDIIWVKLTDQNRTPILVKYRLGR